MIIDEESGIKQKLQQNTNIIDKMRAIGKIGSLQTILDKSSLFGNLNQSYNDLRIESRNGFTSIRANNCVVSGKWVYEVQLLSNKLNQIGWCQLITPFTTTNGVGDDRTSYALDGYRVCKWHEGKEAYGKLWDIGDIIGTAIDLETKTIEFFINGVSQGIAYTSIPTGENIAYFPALSFSADEKCCLNFGNSPFHYSYKGYESFDIPESTFNGSIEITAELLDLLKHYLLKYLINNEVSYSDQINLTHKIFNFLANVSFNDLFTLKTLLIPFLGDLSDKESEKFEAFMKHLLSYINKPQLPTFINYLFDNLCHMIEEQSIIGKRGIDNWKNYLTLFLNFIKINEMVDLLLENKAKFLDYFKNMFNQNLLHLDDIFNYMKNKYSNFQAELSCNQALKEMSSSYYEDSLKYNEKIEKVYQEGFTALLKTFLTDERIFTIRNIKLKQILLDTLRKGFEFTDFNDYSHIFASQIHKKDFSPLFKNLIFNLMNMFLESYIYSNNEDEKNIEFAVDVWFTRLNPESLFYDEVGIGGTLNHVTTEYSNNINEEFKKAPTKFIKESEINNIIMKTLSLTLIPGLKEISKMIERAKNIPLKKVKDFENGNEVLEKGFRSFFYVFTLENQKILYSYAYFIISWLNSLIRKNYPIVYFIPRSIMDLPYDIFKFLLKIRSQVLINKDIRKELNRKLGLKYSEDKFTLEIMFFYTSLFSDQKIANPEIKELLISKIEYFINKKALSKTIEENYNLLELLIKGLLNYMSSESLSHVACEIIVKIIKPMCFGTNFINFEKGALVNVTKKFFEYNPQAFQEFMTNYSKFINKVMTDFSIDLNDVSGKMMGVLPTPQICKKLMTTYTILCDLMKIFEFLLTAYPNEFFDSKTLNYSRFVNFLKNLSSRILDKVYLEQLLKIFQVIKPLYGENILNMAYSIIGIFLNIEENKSNTKYPEFIKKITSLGDLDFEPFLDLYNIIALMKHENDVKNGINKYKEILESYIKIKTEKEGKTVR
jgi:hypothetical protein